MDIENLSVESLLVVFRKKSQFSVEKAVKLLRNNDVVYTAVPPAQPKESKVYFRPDKCINKGGQL